MPEPTEVPPSLRVAEILIDALVCHGLRSIVVSPGSRSSPLVFALRQHPGLAVHVVLDERSAAFFALGIADGTGRPVALVCTSGTAGANYYPAIIEASERGVPILALTADRPDELQGVGAGQTIDQRALFGIHARGWFTTPDPRDIRAGEDTARIAAAAWTAATSGKPGPVQVNCPFRDPLVPPRAEAGREPKPVPDEPTAVVDRPGFHLPGSMRGIGRGLIVAGAAFPRRPGEWRRKMYQLSRHLGWPVLADVLNPARHAPDAPRYVVSQYDAILARGDPAWGHPEAVLQVGPQPTSKVLRDYLGRLEARRWILDPHTPSLDPARKPAEWLRAAAEEVVVADGDSVDLAGEFARAWLSAESAAREVVGELTAPDAALPLGETAVHRLVAESAGGDEAIFLGNSMPVRDAETCLFPGDFSGQVHCNRGANGIDGTVSTALGLAVQGRVWALVGDLALLHDVAGLRLAREVGGRLVLVVLDNGGGRIFAHLPVREYPDVFERFFATPQAVDLAALCRAHSLAFSDIVTADDWRRAREALPETGVVVWRVGLNPESDRRHRRLLRERVAERLQLGHAGPDAGAGTRG